MTDRNVTENIEQQRHRRAAIDWWNQWL